MINFDRSPKIVRDQYAPQIEARFISESVEQFTYGDE